MLSRKVQAQSQSPVEEILHKWETGVYGFSGALPENLQKSRSRKISPSGNWVEKTTLHAMW